ncbi:hypothetical protein GCM10020001_057250 [Nonomuraea salmonea]
MFKRNRHGIQIKSPEQLEKMRAAGLVVGRTLDLLKRSVQPGMTPLDLDVIAEKAIRDEGAIPSFKGYQGFPATICASVNNEVVHGIPTDARKLREGDIISIDCGAILEGWHGDSAVTVPIGEVDPKLTELMRVTEEAMWRGIAALKPGRHLSDIGHEVERYVKSQGRYGIPLSTAATASAPRCTWTRGSPTTASRAAGRRWRRACAWPSSPWSTSAPSGRAYWPTTGPSSRSTASTPHTSSTAWP